MPCAENTEVGVVLAGGKSSRMGRDKALLVGSDGVRLVERAVAVLRAAGLETVWVSGGAELPDEENDLGPIGGIAAAAARVPNGARLVVIPVDMPGLTAQTLLALRAAGATSHFRGFPLPARFVVDETFRDRLREVLAATKKGDRSVRSLLRDAHVLECYDATAFANVNTPEEWAAFLRA